MTISLPFIRFLTHTHTRTVVSVAKTISVAISYCCHYACRGDLIT